MEVERHVLAAQTKPINVRSRRINANLDPVLRDLYRVRTSAREAVVALGTYSPTPVANIGQMFMSMGLAETYLAEWFCKRNATRRTLPQERRFRPDR